MPTFIVDSIEARRQAVKAVSELTSAKVMQVEIKPLTRSLRQNAAYWSVWLRTIEEATGIPSKAWHEFFKKEFIPVDVFKIGNRAVEVGETTTGLNTKEFNEYVEHIHRYCAENLNIDLPELE